MNRLTQEQQQSILSFYFRCGAAEDIDAGRNLIAANPQAAKLYAGLEDTLTDLDHIKYESCPDNLVDLTIARLRLVATGSESPDARLHQLLEQERQSVSAGGTAHAGSSSVRPPNKGGFLRPLFEILAAAASIALLAGILFPSVGVVRAHSRQVACRNNMGDLGRGFASFIEDHGRNNDSLAAAKVKNGLAWWRIGEQGEQSRSNTRYPFMLVKKGYVDGGAFVCRGNQEARVFSPQAAGELDKLYDFPSHKHISYSFSLLCAKNDDPLLCARKIIAGDLNPVFQKIRCENKLFQGADEFVKIQLDEQLKQSMSPNHRGKGQNLLYGDGSVAYARSRIINGDDIYTIKGVNAYTGCEVPTFKNDVFLAP